ncbi:MAG: type II toxin-antitoxin system RelE/ParE family toxin [Xanthomonadales bacterium]|nr:type II toxin-antitoxin system RelE/ParE family toxin [Xanthomonadales bacterium]
MIRLFADKRLQRFAEHGRSGGLPVENAARVRRMLTALKNASAPSDMNLPGYRFHELKGRGRGTYAVTVSGNWRMLFEWDEGAVNVRLEDYH